MVRPRTLIVLLLGAVAAAAASLLMHRAPSSPPAAGIPQSLADERHARISDLRYQLSLDVPAERTESIRGTVVVTFVLTDVKSPLAFDFNQPANRLSSVVANGRRVQADTANGHVMIPPRRLIRGGNRIEFAFTAGDDPFNRGDDYFYSLFVPARASLAFPCFDQPDLKARWTVGIELPAEWSAVSNGAETRLAEHGGRVNVAFAETQPIPTYLVAIAAGRFSVETARRSGRTLRIFHRETDAAKVARNREAIFDLHEQALEWMQTYTGIPYAFGKFDVVLIPSFQFSGMEHPGAVYYNANSLLLDPSATQSQYLNRANTIAHETAHMWFGDLVTMHWFNDVWMKEVFANFMAAKIVNPLFPGVNHDLRFLLQNYPAAYDVDRTAGANPIRQNLANLNEAGSLYGAIIYQKAPVVMRQLERLMGESAFQAGLRDYLTQFSFGNAAWPDLIGILDGRTPADLAAWSRVWVDEPGRPTLHVLPEIAGGRIQRLVIAQEDPRERGLLWPQRMDIRIADAEDLPIAVEGRETEVVEARGLQAPRWILPVGGYGLFTLDDTTLEYVSKSLVAIDDPYVRGNALLDLWDAMLEGKVAAGRVIDDLLRALTRESDELLMQQMLDDVRVAFWRFTAADDRPAIAPRIDSALQAGLKNARSTTAKAAWFETLRKTATTTSAVSWLTDVWRHGAAIDGLPLSEDDEADLAADLALRDVPNADAMLQTELQRLTNPDRRARFAFLLPALSSGSDRRGTFFRSLEQAGNRRHEAWVIDAARYLHHPLRAGSSRAYVMPALELTREIQRTGDIFFPKRWLDATLSGYQTVQTAAEVRAFIDRLPPGYPERLRWMILASADPLFRAAQLLNQ
jgi:aminopeptidase N